MIRLVPRRAFLVGGVALAAAASLSLASPASSAGVGTPVPGASGLAGPLQLEVTGPGALLVSQTFSGTVISIDHGTRTTLAHGTGASGVALGADGSVYFGETMAHQRKSFPHAVIRRVAPGGNITTFANVGAYELAHNPDGDLSYGFQGLSAACAASFPVLPPGEGPSPDPYAGMLDSHPYALASLPDGSLLVADAAANDVLRISPAGVISVLAVIPATSVRISGAEAKALHLPACVVGHYYNLESVPTDVEVVGDTAYVSTLSGGPEDGSLGPTGKVYSIALGSGRVHKIAGGFSGATNLAVTPDGTIYVAELFGGRVSEVVDGRPVTIAEMPFPAGIEYSAGKLYVSDNVFGPGQIVTLRVGS